MSLEDRTTIEDGLNRQEPLKRIASMIGKDRLTIRREIKRHRIALDTSGYGGSPTAVSIAGIAASTDYVNNVSTMDGAWVHPVICATKAVRNTQRSIA